MLPIWLQNSLLLEKLFIMTIRASEFFDPLMIEENPECKFPSKWKTYTRVVFAQRALPQLEWRQLISQMTSFLHTWHFFVLALFLKSNQPRQYSIWQMSNQAPVVSSALHFHQRCGTLATKSYKLIENIEHCMFNQQSSWIFSQTITWKYGEVPVQSLGRHSDKANKIFFFECNWWKFFPQKQTMTLKPKKKRPTTVKLESRPPEKN